MQETTDQQRPVTIPDIAFAAGVSRTTVSMVLNGKADRYRICAATRRRVEAVIAQSGYQPNRMARNMRLGQSTLVGLILSDGTPDVGELLAGLEPTLAGAGYGLVVATVGANPSSARERVQRLNHDGLAGLIYGPGFSAGGSPIIAGLGPTIILGLPTAGLPGVYHDDEQGDQTRPAGMRRSERKRGQVAGELILSILAGAPPGNRRVPLEPLAESELLSSRVAELLKGEAEGQPVSTQTKPVSQPVMPEPSPPPVIVFRPPPIIMAPVPPPPVFEEPIPFTRPEETEIRPQTSEPVFEEPTPETRPEETERPANTATPATNNSATQQSVTAAEPPPVFEPEPVVPTLETSAIAQDPVFDAPTPEIRPEEPQTPVPVVETPVVTGVSPVSVTSPEESPTPADPVSPVAVTPEPAPPLAPQETPTPANDTATSVTPALVPEPEIATPATPKPNNSATQQPTTEAEPPTPPPPAEIVPPVIVIPMAEPPAGVVSETPVSSEIISEPEGVADAEPPELKPEPEIP